MSEQRIKNFLPDDLPYEDWVEFIFDHPILDPQWWWQDEDSEYFKYWNEDADPARTLSYLTRLFTESAQLLPRFSDWQIDQGLNYLVSNSCSNHMFSFLNENLPWEDRKICFDAMIVLYRDLMAPVYGSDPSNIVIRESANRPTYACYIWWDIIPLYGGLEDRDGPMNTAILNIFDQVLRMDEECCLQSALHGLGHWHMYVLHRTDPIIKRFLARTHISNNIRQYALEASVGAVQ